MLLFFILLYYTIKRHLSLSASAALYTWPVTETDRQCRIRSSYRESEDAEHHSSFKFDLVLFPQPVRRNKQQVMDEKVKTQHLSSLCFIFFTCAFSRRTTAFTPLLSLSFLFLKFPGAFLLLSDTLVT